MGCKRSRWQLLPRSALVLCVGGLVSLAEARAQSESDLLIRAACDSALSTAGERQCLREFLERADRDLNAIVSRLLASMDAKTPGTAEYKNWMTKAQENWVQFRQFDCGAVFYEWSGTIRASMILTCRVRHTLDRIRTLKDHFPPDKQLYPPEYRKYFPPK